MGKREDARRESWWGTVRAKIQLLAERENAPAVTMLDRFVRDLPVESLRLIEGWADEQLDAPAENDRVPIVVQVPGSMLPRMKECAAVLDMSLSELVLHNIAWMYDDENYPEQLGFAYGDVNDIRKRDGKPPKPISAEHQRFFDEEDAKWAAANAATPSHEGGGEGG